MWNPADSISFCREPTCSCLSSAWRPKAATRRYAAAGAPHLSIGNVCRSSKSSSDAPALKTASDALKTHLFSAMSSRAAEYLRDDLANLGSVRLTEVEAAQREIVETALKLSAEGVMNLGGDSDDMV